MKRLYLIILLCSCLIGQTILAQKSIEKVSVLYILSDLEAKHGVYFAFDPELLKDKKVQRQLEEVSLEKALEEVCREAGLQQLFTGNQILLRPKKITEPKQKYFHFSGKIKDASMGEPLVGVLVFSGGHYTETDENGWFEIQVPAQNDEAELCLNYLGYENTCQVMHQSTQHIDFNLKPQSFEVEAVTITSVAIQMNIDKLDIVNQTKIPALSALSSSPVGSDILRGIQLLAGIDATNDLSADISIRNGDHEETLIMLEEIPLYHTSHMQGFFSTLNPLVTDEIEVYKNSIPIDKSSRTGGLVLAKVNGFGDDAFGGAVELNNLTANVLLNTRHNKTKLLVAGRTSLGTISANSAFISEGEIEGADRDITVYQFDPNYEFQDLNLSFQTAIGKTKLAINALYSLDLYDGFTSFEVELEEEDVEDEQEEEDEDEEEEEDGPQNPQQTIEETLTNRQETSGLGLGASLHHPLNDFWTVSLEAATSRYDFRETSEYVQRGINLFSAENTLRQSLVKLQSEYRPNKKLALSTGVIRNLYHVEFDFKYTNFKYLNPDNADAASWAIFSKLNKKLGKKTYLGLSGRAEYYNLNQKWYPAAMVTLQHRINAGWLLKSSWSKSNQLIRKVQHQGNFGSEVSFWALADEKLFPVLVSDQWMAGTSYKGENGLALDVEAFYRTNQGVAQYALANFLRSDSDLNRLIQYLRKFEGESRTLGLDFSLSKEWKNLTNILNYSWADKQLRFDGIAQGAWFQSPDRRLHQLKSLNVYEFKNWQFSLNMILGSSTRTINLDELEEEDRDIRAIPFEELYEELPSYFRLDVGIRYKLQTKNNPIVLSFNTFNLTNRENVLARYYIRLRAPKANISNIGAFEQALLGRIFNFGISYKW